MTKSILRVLTQNIVCIFCLKENTIQVGLLITGKVMATGDPMSICNLCKETYYTSNGHSCKIEKILLYNIPEGCGPEDFRGEDYPDPKESYSNDPLYIEIHKERDKQDAIVASYTVSSDYTGHPITLPEKQILAITVRDSLKGWVDFDVAEFKIAVALGIMPDDWDWVLSHAKWVLWTNNKVGNMLSTILRSLVDAEMVLENADGQFKWNPDWSVK